MKSLNNVLGTPRRLMHHRSFRYTVEMTGFGVVKPHSQVIIFRRVIGLFLGFAVHAYICMIMHDYVRSIGFILGSNLLSEGLHGDPTVVKLTVATKSKSLTASLRQC